MPTIHSGATTAFASIAGLSALWVIVCHLVSAHFECCIASSHARNFGWVTRIMQIVPKRDPKSKALPHLQKEEGANKSLLGTSEELAMRCMYDPTVHTAPSLKWGRASSAWVFWAMGTENLRGRVSRAAWE